MRDFPIPASPESSATLPSPAAGVAPALDEQRDFGLAADKGRHALRPCGFEPAYVFLFAKDRENPGRGRKAF